ncbi:MAG TPA: cytochrome c [Anaerolineaceae bacterium]
MTTANNPVPSTPPQRRLPVFAIVAGVIAVVVGLFVLYLVIQYLLPAQPPSYPAQGQAPLAPRQTQLALINSLGWVSRPTGAAHIPIDRAMQIIATQGVPTLVEVPGQNAPQPTAAGGGGSPGAALFQSLGCIGCHGAANSAIAPTLNGIYGKPVQLEGGQTVAADDAYLKESIVSPAAKVVKGFNPIMPSFQGKVDDNQIAQLIDYIKSLK